MMNVFHILQTGQKWWGFLGYLIAFVQACGKLPFGDPITKIRCFSPQIGVVFHTSLLLMMSLSGGHSSIKLFYWVDLNSILLRIIPFDSVYHHDFGSVNHSTLYTTMKFGVSTIIHQLRFQSGSCYAPLGVGHSGLGCWAGKSAGARCMCCHHGIFHPRRGARERAAASEAYLEVFWQKVLIHYWIPGQDNHHRSRCGHGAQWPAKSEKVDHGMSGSCNPRHLLHQQWLKPWWISLKIPMGDTCRAIFPLNKWIVRVRCPFYDPCYRPLSKKPGVSYFIHSLINNNLSQSLVLPELGPLWGWSLGGWSREVLCTFYM